MRLIDADAICAGRISNDPVVIATKCESTIDAVEVIRCKDCKHWVIDDYWNGNPAQVRACRFAGWMCGANGYCMYGERKIDAEVE